MGTFFNTLTSSVEGLVIPTFAFVFNLKVFAIFYPNAIARAVISPAVAAGFPAIFSVPVILAVP